MNWWTSCDSGNCGAGRGEGVQALRLSMVTREGMAVSITLPRTSVGPARRELWYTGAAFGIVGANGAGKSTLLKIIARATTSSEGSVTSNGRVAALLELGMGFHPEFTGRQNVMMAGQLLGLSLTEIEGAFSDIERFADIGDFMDQPLRTYWRGMQMRLAFSVATAVRPDVLIVDEALSVGDVAFQRKCYQRIEAFCAEGTALLFVSHDIEAVKRLCDQAIFLPMVVWPVSVR